MKKLLFFPTLSLLAGALSGADWYVAPSGGSNANPGTLAAPFASVAKAISVSAPGDTIHLRGGFYMESKIAPTKSGAPGNPITITAYTPPGGEQEEAILSGFAMLTPGAGGVGTWQNHSGSIYKIQLTAPSFSLVPRGWYLFMVGGQVLTEASWPDRAGPAGFDWRDMASADSGTIDTVTTYPAYGYNTGSFYQGTYTDADLPALSDNAWAGAKIDLNAGYGWFWKTGEVVGSSGPTLTFRFPWSGGHRENPANGDPYFLWDSLQALDAPGEAFFDFDGRFGPANTLYAWMPDSSNPAGLPVYRRNRVHVFEFDNDSHYRLEDLQFLAGSVLVQDTCTGIELENVTMQYCGYNLDSNWGGYAEAVEFKGTGHSLTGSHIRYNYGSGVEMRGSGHTVRDNVIHDNHGKCVSVVNGITSGLTVEENTLFRAGGAVLDIGAIASRYAYNHAYFNGMHITDAAVANTYDSGDAAGTEVAYNWFHSGIGRKDNSRNWYGSQGIRLDNGGAIDGCSNFLIHHNIIWNVSTEGGIVVYKLTPTMVNYGNAQVHVYNNTSLPPIVINGSGLMDGMEFRNNIAGRFINYVPPNDAAVIGGNLFEETTLAGNLTGRAQYVSANRANLALRAGSPAINAGATIPGITDGFSGSAPDIGALESGQPRWLAGAKLRPGDLAALQFTARLDDDAQPYVEVTGLPVGRIFPQDAVIRLKLNGDAFDQTALYHDFDLEVHTAGANAAFTGLQPGQAYSVEVALDGVSFTPTTAIVAIPDYTLGTVSPQNVATTGTTLSTLGATSPARNHVRIPVDVDQLLNDASLQISVPLTLDTASLIAEGVLQDDGTNLSVTDLATGQNLDWARDTGWNTSATLLWFRFPDGSTYPDSFGHGSSPLVEIRLEQAPDRYSNSELPDAAAIRAGYPAPTGFPEGQVFTAGRKNPPVLTLGSQTVTDWFISPSGELTINTPVLSPVDLPEWLELELAYTSGALFSAGNSLLLHTPAYDAWAAAVFPNGTPPADTLPEANPDGDSQPNFAEFALGRNPLAYDGADYQRLDGDTFSFRIKNSATDVLVSIELSDNLQNWSEHRLQDIGLTLTDPDPDGTGTFNEWAVTLPVATNPFFARLKLVPIP